MGTVSIGVAERAEAEEGSQSASELKRSDPSWNSRFWVYSEAKCKTVFGIVMSYHVMGGYTTYIQGKRDIAISKSPVLVRYVDSFNPQYISMGFRGII